MIDNGSKSWTLFTYRQDTSSTNWLVVGTKWNNAGPTKDERTAGCYESEQAALDASIKMQREYDKLRNMLLSTAREVNRSE
jgi:hypothetical protein